MTDKEVRDLLQEFAAPLSLYVTSPDRKTSAKALVKSLWLAMITGPEIEEETWEILRTRGNLDDELLDSIQTCYYEKMKPVVGAEQLAALRERYKVSPKDLDERSRECSVNVRNNKLGWREFGQDLSLLGKQRSDETTMTLGHQGEVSGSSMMSEQKEHDRRFPVRFTLAQRIVVAEVFPKYSERLRLDGERSISFGSRGDPCCSRKCLPLKMVPASRLVVRT